MNLWFFLSASTNGLESTLEFPWRRLQTSSSRLAGQLLNQKLILIIKYEIWTIISFNQQKYLELFSLFFSWQVDYYVVFSAAIDHHVDFYLLINQLVDRDNLALSKVLDLQSNLLNLPVIDMTLWFRRHVTWHNVTEADI